MRWIIGDIHGMLRPLEAVLDAIRRRDAAARFCFVGDYVNRGPESRGVVDLLLSLDPSTARFIRGNHDDVLDLILHGISHADNASRGDRFNAYQWFLEHGLYDTLLSYGATEHQISQVVSRRSHDALDAVIDRFPTEHRRFIRTLPLFIEDDDLFIVHGKWPLNESATPAEVFAKRSPPAARQESLWGRYTSAELKREPVWTKRGYFGHTPVQTYPEHADRAMPLRKTRLVLLDTAAALLPTGRLTAMCAETGELIQSNPKGKLIEPRHHESR